MTKKNNLCIDCSMIIWSNSKRCRKCFMLYYRSFRPKNGRKYPLCKDCKKMTGDKYSVRCRPCRHKFQVGKNNPHWKGGVHPEYQKIRNSDEYAKWRKAVFEQDNYTCHMCKDDKGGNLVAHHMLTFKNYPKMRLNIDIGLTLCETCHINIHRKKSLYVLDWWYPGGIFL